MTVKTLHDAIKNIADFPQLGVVFKDITPALLSSQLFAEAIDLMCLPCKNYSIKKNVGIEARGFILGGAVAHELGRGFIPIRKKGKLPFKTIGKDYSLEYGVDRVEIHSDAIKTGDKILLIDDLIATGGTAVAATDLLHESGAKIVAAAFIVDLPDLGGAQKLRKKGIKLHTLVSFDGDKGKAHLA